MTAISFFLKEQHLTLPKVLRGIRYILMGIVFALVFFGAIGDIFGYEPTAIYNAFAVLCGVVAGILIKIVHNWSKI